MLGSMISLSGYMAVLGILVLWMVVKIWRSSPVLAVATFFVWPLSVISLVRNWGDSDTDIRIPFFLSLVTVGAIFWMSDRVVDKAFEEAGPVFTAQEIEAIRQENPQFAAELEARQLEASLRAEALQAEQRSASRPAGADGPGREADAGQSLDAEQTQSVEQIAAANEAQRRFQLRTASRALKFQRGSVRLEPARSTLALPLHFRFVDANQLFRLSRLRDVALDGGSLGWVVHERVDLADPAAWFIDLRFEEAGYLAVGQGGGVDALQQQIALLGLSPEGVQFGSGNYAPQWDARSAIATWMRSAKPVASRTGSMHVALAAARPLRHGLVLARVADLPMAERELGLRAARLLVNSVRPDAGWRYADYRAGRDPVAGTTLAEWVANH
jgi:hypothetical protein